MLVALIAAFVAYAPAHLARGICSGSGRFRDYAIVMGSRRRRAHRALRRPRRHRHHGRRRRTGSPSPWRRSFGVGSVSAQRRAAHRARAPSRRGARSRRTSAGCCSARCSPRSLLNAGPIADHAARRRRRQDAASRSSPTACCSPASRCSCSRPCRRRCCPASAGSPPRASSTSSAAGSERLMLVVARRRRRRHAGRVRARAVRHRDRVRRRPQPAARWRCSPSAAPATCWRWPLAQAVIALTGHALVALGWASASSPSCSARGSPSDDLFRRIEIGLRDLVGRGADRVRHRPALPAGDRRRARRRLGDGSDHRHALRDLTALDDGVGADACGHDVGSDAGLLRPRSARSWATIILTSVAKSTSGSQPSSVRALVASPISRSTSAGRKNFGSWRT